MAKQKQKVGIFNINANQFNQRKQREAREARKAAAESLGTQANEGEISLPSADEVRTNMERAQRIDAMYPFTNEHIPLDKLRPAKQAWNFFPVQNAQMLSDLVGNIAMYGQTTPARVWKQSDGTYVILGGHTRFEALKKLHELYQSGKIELEHDFDTMWCSVYDVDTLDDIEARKIIIYDNTMRRNNTKSLMARSIINMNLLMRNTRPSRRPDTKRVRIAEQIAENLGVSRNTVNGIYKLRNLIPEFWPLLDEPDKAMRITDAFAQAVAMLPKDLQKYVSESGIWVDRKFKPSQLKALSKVTSTEEIDELFTAPEKYSVGAKTEIAQPLPEGYKAVVLAASPDEIPIIKEMIEKADSISDETKRLIKLLLNDE